MCTTPCPWMYCKPLETCRMMSHTIASDNICVCSVLPPPCLPCAALAVTLRRGDLDLGAALEELSAFACAPLLFLLAARPCPCPCPCPCPADKRLASLFLAKRWLRRLGLATGLAAGDEEGEGEGVREGEGTKLEVEREDVGVLLPWRSAGDEEEEEDENDNNGDDEDVADDEDVKLHTWSCI
jgi:hypothetical protein